jgi:tetraacyldisaccharide 4'-kinase
MKSSLIMMPFSVLYSAVTRARLEAYRRGLFSVTRLSVPVISVGNITTGGTGKTPLVEWACRVIAKTSTAEHAEEKTKVCVLTRGYGRANPAAQVVVSNGTEILTHEREAGDEPSLLARNLLGTAAVICNPNRVAAGQWAIEQLKTEAFVLDDGFQHLRIFRDLDIVTIDATNPWGGGEMLPDGRLREAVSGLSRADCVVITRAEQVEDLSPLNKAIKSLVGEAPVFTSRMVTSELRNIGGDKVDPAGLLAQPLAAFCGVGNPGSFFAHLQNEGFDLVTTSQFPDHHRYQQAELNAIVRNAKAHGAIGLITTAKDAIKIGSLEGELPCYVLEIRISIDEEERLVGMIRKAISKSPQS